MSVNKQYRIRVEMISKDSGKKSEKLFDVDGGKTVGEIYSLARAQLGVMAIKTSEHHAISKIEVEGL